MGHWLQPPGHHRVIGPAWLWLWLCWAGAWPLPNAAVLAQGHVPSLQPLSRLVNHAMHPAQWEGWVTKVVDGDTLHVQPAQGGISHKLRIKGIDAPEVCQAWGMQSREALARLVWGQRVTVRVHDVDDHGRWLAQVMVHGEDVGAQLVAQGHAWSYQFRRDPGPYVFQQQQAAINRMGLFGQPQAMRPREFRQRHGPCP